MTEAERAKAERAKAELKAREEALNKREREIKLQAYSLEAQKQLKENGLSADLVDMVLSDDVDVTQKRIKTLANKFNEAVQAKVKELSKTGTPRTSSSKVTGTETLAEAFKRQLK